jgi:hypothetical protein
MLKGEQAEAYLTPSRERKLVCSLCAPRAQREGWIRESAAPETPTRPARDSDRRGLLRWRRRRDTDDSGGGEVPEAEFASEHQAEPASESIVTEPEHSTPRDPRHVRAVPTNAELKLDRAIEVFCESEHARTIAGLARTLGPPRVSVLTSPSSTAEVAITVAWELSWYQYVVDLSDPNKPVELRGRGDELDELPDEAREWNAEAGEDGALALKSANAASNGDAGSTPGDG